MLGCGISNLANAPATRNGQVPRNRAYLNSCHKDRTRALGVGALGVTAFITRISVGLLASSGESSTAPLSSLTLLQPHSIHAPPSPAPKIPQSILHRINSLLERSSRSSADLEGDGADVEVQPLLVLLLLLLSESDRSGGGGGLGGGERVRRGRRG